MGTDDFHGTIIVFLGIVFLGIDMLILVISQMNI
jgi:hypothetical protein